jgi:hypothetical protein
MSSALRFAAPLFLVSLLAAPAPASAETPARERFPVQANGVTPGGLLFTAAANGKLVLRDESGGLRATYTAAREEFVVLGMEDDGRRVTSRTRYPIGRGSGTSEVAASYTFRSSDWSILTKRRVVSQGAAPVPFGAAVYSLGKNGRALTVQRTSASEEAVPVFTLEGPIATRSLGKPSGMALHVSAAGLVLERRFSSGALYAFALPANKVAEVKYQKSECDAEMLDVYPSAGRLTILTREYDGRRSVLEGLALSAAGEAVLRRDLGAFDRFTGLHPLETGGLLDRLAPQAGLRFRAPGIGPLRSVDRSVRPGRHRGAHAGAGPTSLGARREGHRSRLGRARAPARGPARRVSRGARPGSRRRAGPARESPEGRPHNRRGEPRALDGLLRPEGHGRQQVEEDRR